MPRPAADRGSHHPLYCGKPSGFERDGICNPVPTVLLAAGALKFAETLRTGQYAPSGERRGGSSHYLPYCGKPSGLTRDGFCNPVPTILMAAGALKFAETLRTGQHAPSGGSTRGSHHSPYCGKPSGLTRDGICNPVPTVWVAAGALRFAETLRTGQHAPSGESHPCLPRHRLSFARHCQVLHGTGKNCHRIEGHGGGVGGRL